RRRGSGRLTQSDDGVVKVLSTVNSSLGIHAVAPLCRLLLSCSLHRRPSSPSKLGDSRCVWKMTVPLRMRLSIFRRYGANEAVAVTHARCLRGLKPSAEDSKPAGSRLGGWVSIEAGPVSETVDPEKHPVYASVSKGCSRQSRQ